jgi:hypothetical protein
MNAPVAAGRVTAPMISAAAFMKRHLPGLRTWPRARLLEYLGWYWRDARVGILRDHGRIVGIALGRCLHDVKQAREHYFHDEAARIIWIEHIVSRHPLGIRLLLQQAMQRFGPREAFAGDVFKRDGELRMLPWKTVERLTTALPPHELINSRPTAAA